MSELRPRVLFAFDRVAHYHVPLLRRLEQELAREGLRLHLAAGDAKPGATGRVGVAARVIEHEHRYPFSETVLAGWTLRRAPALARIVQEVAPCAVVCMAHVGHLAHWALVRAQRRQGFALVAWQCGYEYHEHPLKAALLKRFVPRFDHHLAYHGRAAAYALRHGASPQAVTVMHNTIDESRVQCLDPAQARERLQDRHPELAGRRIVLFVGALLAEKRLQALLQATERLGRADVALLVVGDGPEAASLRAQVAGRGDVILAGAVLEGVGAYFDAADVYVLPGTGGLGINEAMAHGLPVISGDADGSADDLVIPGITGLRWRSGDPDELAGLIATVLDDPHAARAMGRAGRQRITGDLCFTRMVDRVRAVLVDQARRALREGAPGRRCVPLATGF